ncbi:DUF6207 family protein [Streptomyces inhibens]|uniref:DUF6207 family protein n=1 Tax=Streptomyces inhibens TaxID=2293571 RepID=UPI003CCA43E8
MVVRLRSGRLPFPALRAYEAPAPPGRPGAAAVGTAAGCGARLSSGPSAPWHTPGQPGVTVRAYADLRRAPLTGGSFDPGAA